MSIIKNFNNVKLYDSKKESKSNTNSYILLADFETRKVTTNCGDSYYDTSINFDDFIKFAKYIEDRKDKEK